MRCCCRCEASGRQETRLILAASLHTRRNVNEVDISRVNCTDDQERKHVSPCVSPTHQSVGAGDGSPRRGARSLREGARGPSHAQPHSCCCPCCPTLVSRWRCSCTAVVLRRMLSVASSVIPVSIAPVTGEAETPAVFPASGRGGRATGPPRPSLNLMVLQDQLGSF